MLRLLLALILVAVSVVPATAQIVTTPPRVINNPTFTGPAKFADGTAAAPSRTYTSDDDLGTYRIGANNEGFTAGGVLRWDYNTTRLLFSAGYQLTAGANTLIGTTADKLNAVHLAIASQVIGDVLYADSATTFARLAGVATGQVFTSGGVGVAPAWSASPALTALSTTGIVTATGGVDVGGSSEIRTTTSNRTLIYHNTASRVQVGGAQVPIQLYPSAQVVVGSYDAGGVAFRNAAGVFEIRNFDNTVFATARASTLNATDSTNQIVLDSDAAVNTGTITMAALTAARTWTNPDLSGTYALTANNLGAFAATTSAQLAGVVSDEQGSGALVLATSPTLTSPTLVTPALGTPASGVATNLTGTAAGLTAGNVTTNANLTGPITSTGNATAVATQTGTGSTFVMQTSPTLTTPAIGAATGISVTLSGLTANSFLYSGTAGLLTTTAAPTNGQLLIGSTGAAPVAAAITAGANITVTNTAGAITIASTAGGGATYCRDVTTAEVVNTVTETTVFTCTVTANDLSTNKMLRLTLIGDYLNDSGVNRSLTVRVKYGATTIFSGGQGGITTSASRRSLQMVTHLSANNTASAQVASSNMIMGSAGDDTGTGNASFSDRVGVHNAVAIDSTVNQALIVTFEHDAAATTVSAKAFVVQLELI